MFCYLSRSGPPAAMNCPVVMCDQCQTPIQGRERPGIVIWGNQRDGRQRMATLHQGACDNTFVAAHPEDDWLSEDLDAFLEVLLHNTTHQFPAEDNVEYVAPAPSRWRQGHYRRTTLPN